MIGSGFGQDRDSHNPLSKGKKEQVAVVVLLVLTEGPYSIERRMGLRFVFRGLFRTD